MTILLYVEEHNNTFPVVLDTNLVPAAILRCPIAPKLQIGYGYNKFLVGKTLKKILNPDDILLTADTGEHNADHFITTFNDILPRHGGYFGASYLDGHVSIMKANSPIKLQ